MRLIHISQIYLHLITGDPTIPHGASSRRSHGERIMLETPKDPIHANPSCFLLRWTSTGQAHPPRSHTGGRSSTTAQQSTSSPQAKPSSFPIFSSLLIQVFQLPLLRLSKAEGSSRAAILRLRPPGTSLLSPILFWISRFLTKPQK